MSGLPDRRRNVGPTDLAPFHVSLPATQNPKTEPQHRKTVRPIFVSQGVCANANGSAYIEVGETRMQCVVHGPLPLKGDYHSRAVVEVNVDAKLCANIKVVRLESLMVDFVRSAIVPSVLLEEYPRSQFTVYITVLSCGPSIANCLSVGVNGATAALVNAGISLKDMVTAVSLAKVDDSFQVDADQDEGEKEAVLAFMTASSLLTSIVCLGGDPISKNEFAEMTKKALDGSVTVRQILNSYLIEEYAQLAKA